MFFQPLDQFIQGQPSKEASSQLLILGQDMLPNIQQLQINLGMLGVANLLNNVYNLVQQ